MTDTPELWATLRFTDDCPTGLALHLKSVVGHYVEHVAPVPAGVVIDPETGDWKVGTL